MKEPPFPTIFYLILLAGSAVLFREAYRIEGFGSASGPGTFPMIAAGTMMVCLLALIVKSVLAGCPAATEPESLSERIGRVVTWPTVAYMGVCAAYVAALEFVGFWIASAVFLFLSFAALHRKGVVRAAVATGLALVFVYVVFRFIFQVYLP